MKTVRKQTVLERLATFLFSRLPFIAERWAKSFKAVKSDDIPWTPLVKALAECRVALVTTAGVHLKTQPPFDMVDKNGDFSFREIPADASRDELTITHNYYDHTDADRDINIVYPIDRLKEMADAGEIGDVSPRHFGFMGHIVEEKIESLINDTAPQVASRLLSDEVDLVLLTPG